MFKLDLFKPTLSRTFGRVGLKVQKYSPEILTGVGVAGVITAGVLASRATLKLSPIIEAKDEDLKKIKETRQRPDADDLYPESAANQDTAKVYVRTGLDILKLYGPSITLGLVSIGCIVSATGIMRKRNLAMAAAYKTVEQAFTEYRQRVAEELGDEQELDIYHSREEVEVTDEETGEKSIKKVVRGIDCSPYARFFDETSEQWSESSDYNLVFLKSQEQYFNQRLHAKGHVFLNEVYDALGIPRTKAGQAVGWFRGNGDDFIDFGMYDINSNPQVSGFLDGTNPGILLDFNVDGPIHDLI